MRTEWAAPRQLAAIHAVTTQQRLSTDIPRLVGQIWPVLREQGARTGHFGDYAQMAPAYAALEQWWTRNGRRPAGVSWEVYGDWDDDPAKVRTDIYFLLRPAAG